MATRPTFARCIECGRDIHRGPPPQTVVDPDTVPFAASPDCFLQRRGHGGGLCYFDVAGLLQAVVSHDDDGSTRCRSLAGTVVFAIAAYEPGGLGSFVVLDAADEGRPIGTYVVRSRVPELVVDVRDSTSAPIGTLHGMTTTFRIDETGGARLAIVERLRIALDERWHDDRWSLDVVAEPPTLDRRALVASLLVCHHLASTGPIDTADS